MVEKKLLLDLLTVLHKHGVIGNNVLRNEKIRQEYEELRRTGIKGKIAREKIADKNNIDMKTVEAIIYKKRYEYDN
jgi:hypothetical protein